MTKSEVVTNGLKTYKSNWVGGKLIKATAYDSQCAGYQTFNTVSVRLWSALPIFGSDNARQGETVRQLRMTRQASNRQTLGAMDDQHADIIETRKECEKITCVPYPRDRNQSKKIQELVIKQQYFFMAATLKDILRRFKKRNGFAWEKLPEKISLYLLELHHAVGILELLRLLVDDHGLTF